MIKRCLKCPLFGTVFLSKIRPVKKLWSYLNVQSVYNFLLTTSYFSVTMVTVIDAHGLKIQGRGYLKFLPKKLSGGPPI